MLKIWGRPNSINVQKVLWTADEMGLDYEHTVAGGAHGGMEAVERMNPNKLVPVIDDEGFVQWESNAIVRYLAAKHDMGGLCPQGLQERALADQWMDWSTFTVVTAMTPVFWGLVRTAPEDRDRAAIEKGIAGCQAAFARLNAHLEGRDYVLGSTFTMADVPLGCATYRWHALDVPHRSLPALEAWYERLRDRPAFRERVMLPLT